MSLGLASLLLAVATFLAGTVTPAIYRRFSHVGISIKPLNIRMQTQRGGWVVWATVLKVANATRGSILIDDVYVPRFRVGRHLVRVESSLLADVTESSHVYVPIERSPERNFQVLPLILKQDETRVYVLQLTLRSDDDAASLTEELRDELLEPTIKLRINGISRRFALRQSDYQPVVGYDITVAGDE